jgi:hypothetical protein
MARPKEWPNPPKWTEDFPCPRSVTLYRSALAIKQFKKDVKMPPEPDWKKIWEDYRNLKK